MYFPPKHPYTQPNIQDIDNLEEGQVRAAQLTDRHLLIAPNYDSANQDIVRFLRKANNQDQIDLRFAYELPANFNPTAKLIDAVCRIKCLVISKETYLLALEDVNGQELIQFTLSYEGLTAYTQQPILPPAPSGMNIKGYPVLAKIPVQDWRFWVGQYWETHFVFQEGKCYLNLMTGGNWGAETYLYDLFGNFTEKLLELNVVSGDLPTGFNPQQDHFSPIPLAAEGRPLEHKNWIKDWSGPKQDQVVNIGILKDDDKDWEIPKIEIATKAELIITTEWPE